MIECGVARGGASPSGRADVIDTILDKGLVIDAYVGVSLVGIELLTINARIVVASVDTYLRFAEAVNRLDLSESSGEGLPELMKDITAQRQVSGKGEAPAQGALEAAGEQPYDFDSDQEPQESARRRRHEEG
jgi:hypothetical protein